MSENNEKSIKPVFPMHPLDEVERAENTDNVFNKKIVLTKNVNTETESIQSKIHQSFFKNRSFYESFVSNQSESIQYRPNLYDLDYLREIERTTNIIGVRVPAKYHLMYKSFNLVQKYMFKLAVVSLIEAIAKGSMSASTGIVNLNLNLNVDMNMLMNKIEADNENIEVLKEKLDLYRDRLKICNEKVKMMKELEKEIEKLKLLENEAKRALEMYRQRKITSETALEIIRRALEKK
jgi:hypothetical protein